MSRNAEGAQDRSQTAGTRAFGAASGQRRQQVVAAPIVEPPVFEECSEAVAIGAVNHLKPRLRMPRGKQPRRVKPRVEIGEGMRGRFGGAAGEREEQQQQIEKGKMTSDAFLDELEIFIAEQLQHVDGVFRVRGPVVSFPRADPAVESGRLVGRQSVRFFDEFEFRAQPV